MYLQSATLPLMNNIHIFIIYGSSWSDKDVGTMNWEIISKHVYVYVTAYPTAMQVDWLPPPRLQIYSNTESRRWNT